MLQLVDFHFLWKTWLHEYKQKEVKEYWFHWSLASRLYNFWGSMSATESNASQQSNEAQK